MAGTPLTLHAPDPAATDAIGAALAGMLLPGDVVLLEGDLGAGKSALARALIRARLGDPEMEVPSPTFALVQPYDRILHADLYRLADESEMAELGLLDDPEAVVLVEWPDRAPGLFALPGLTVSLAIPQGRAGRSMIVTPRGARDAEALQKTLAPWIVAP